MTLAPLLSRPLLFAPRDPQRGLRVSLVSHLNPVENETEIGAKPNGKQQTNNKVTNKKQIPNKYFQWT
jgi:hypothetical protein